jgi:hypothetical protein
MAHRQAYRSIPTERIRIASRDSAHLAGVTIPFKHPSASFLGYAACESGNSLDCFQEVLILF